MKSVLVRVLVRVTVVRVALAVAVLLAVPLLASGIGKGAVVFQIASEPEPG